MIERLREKMDGMEREGRPMFTSICVPLLKYRMLGFSMAPLALRATFLSRPKELDHVSKF